MDELVSFVRTALAGGHSRDEIRQTLRSAGWVADEVERALEHFADIPFSIPVPRPRQSGSAKDAFLYLVTFLALYTSATALGSLLFTVIEHFLPDAAAHTYRGRGDLDGLRWNIAALIVAFPLYYGLTQMHHRSYARDPERRTSGVRRWLTYLTMFIAACVALGNLIYVLGSVLGGEIAARFLLKTAVTILLSAGIFLFYYRGLREVEQPLNTENDILEDH